MKWFLCNFCFNFFCYRRDLVNQEAKFTAKLEEAEKRTTTAELKIGELQYKLNDLDRELSTRSWNVDRKLIYF